MAAPHAAARGVILALRPAWQPEQVRAQLTAYADDIGTAGYDIYTGWGRINARRAVAALGLPQPLAAPEAAQPPAQPDINLPTPSRSAAYVPGEILFKPREGRVPADVLPASVRESGFRSELAVARAGVWVLRVPPGEELTWLARLRVSPDVLSASSTASCASTRSRQ